MPEDAELAALPPASPLRKLRPATIDLARRIDGIIALLEDEQGYGELHIEVRRGMPCYIWVKRGYKIEQ